MRRDIKLSLYISAKESRFRDGNQEKKKSRKGNKREKKGALTLLSAALTPDCFHLTHIELDDMRSSLTQTGHSQ